MQLEVGMYVRDEGGLIAKYLGFKDYKYEFDNFIYWFYEYYNDFVYEDDFKEWFEEEVVKTSLNIKELLVVGDIITYEYPTGLGMCCHKNVEITEHLLDVLKNGENNHEYKIKSIVTKEQFENMSYEVVKK